MTRWRDALQPADTILVAVSGGSDSVAMLLRLAAEAPRHDWRLHVAHVHHHLQPGFADEAAAFVEQLAAQLGLPFSMLHLHDDELRARPAASTSLEARIGDERLRLMKSEAHRIGARVVALGHTADDAAETFLLMALRGSGPRGLGSMREVLSLSREALVLIRPVLEATRDELRAELYACGQKWIDDPTNATGTFARNRLRHEVLPVLTAMEPAAARMLARSGSYCYDTESVLRAFVDADEQGILFSRMTDSVLIDTARFRASDPHGIGIRLRVLYGQVLHNRIGTEAGRSVLPPPHAFVEDLAARLASEPTGNASFGPAQGYAAWLSSGWVLLAYGADVPPWREHWSRIGMTILLSPGTSLPILNSTQRATPGRYTIELPDNQGMLVADVIDAAGFSPDWQSPAYAGALVAAIDARTIKRDLYLRALNGDEKIPIGGGVQQDAAELLRAARVPSDVRANVAALSDDRGPLWIPGVRRAVTGYVTPRTELVLVVTRQMPQEMEGDES